MIALDTNILVRLITRDDEAQAQRAKALFDRYSAIDGAFFVADIVLVELCWVLERSYQLSRAEIGHTVQALLNNATVQLETPAVVRAALEQFDQSTIGFPDCLIVAKAKHANCECTMTFDRHMSALDTVQLL